MSFSKEYNKILWSTYAIVSLCPVGGGCLVPLSRHLDSLDLGLVFSVAMVEMKGVMRSQKWKKQIFIRKNNIHESMQFFKWKLPESKKNIRNKINWNKRTKKVTLYQYISQLSGIIIYCRGRMLSEECQGHNWFHQKTWIVAKWLQLPAYVYFKQASNEQKYTR